MKRFVAVLVGATAIALATPALASADTGSADGAAFAQLFSSISSAAANCGFNLFSTACSNPTVPPMVG